MIPVFLIPLFYSKAFADYATILVYHRFGDDRYPSTSVSLEDFEAQMKFLREQGFKVIPLSSLINSLRKREKIQPKTVVITIDDGYKSTMKAFEILKKFNYPFTVFLYMEAVDRYPDFLSLEDIKKLKNYGKVEFENHSYSHRAFGLMRDTETFLKDLEKSEERFEKIFGHKPNFYALPFGYYNSEILAILKEKGYKAVFTQDPGNVNNFTDLYRIPRQAIVGSWSKMENFKKKLFREALTLQRLIPTYGFLEENPPEKIGAVLKYPNLYKDCRIYITELGWEIAKRKGNFVFRDNIPFLKRKWNRVGVKCRNLNGKWAESFWIIAR